MKKNTNILDLPTTNYLINELKRENYKLHYRKLLISTIYTLIIVMAISVLIATYIFPVLRIYGDTMSPNLETGDIVVGIKQSNFKRGDVIAFYYNNNILIKRIIATSGELVNIDEAGNVYINDKLMTEAYIKEKAYGEVDIEFPYQVPEGTYFVLGDKRTTSADSRNSLIGTIPKSDIFAKIIFKVWPINHFRVTT